MKIMGKYAGALAIAVCFLAGAVRSVRADTIDVDNLINNGGSIISGNPYESYTYTTHLSGSGAVVDNTDTFTIKTIAGYAGFGTPGTTTAVFTDVDGNSWNASGNLVTGDITVSYAPSQPEEKGSLNPLVDITFLDIFAKSGVNTQWTSANHSYNPTSDVTSLTASDIVLNGSVDSPDPNSGAPIVPSPVSLAGGTALLGLLLLGQSKRRFA